MTEPRVRDLAIADCSDSLKAGLKGPRAAAWLGECGISVPAGANTWLPLPGGGLVARLGESEFLLDGAPSSDVISKVLGLLGNPPARVYPVLRQDMVIALIGPRINEVLLQTCSIDFTSLDNRTQLVLTSMVGVSIVAIPLQDDRTPTVKIWADPTFGPYLWRTLLGIVRELDGELAVRPAYLTTTEEAQWTRRQPTNS